MKILFLILSLCFIQGAHATSMYPFESVKKEVQFRHLLTNLRCLVCQNQDLSDSNAPLAKDLRWDVYQLVEEGKSDTDIEHYLTSRYGDFILFKPPLKALTAVLWLGPALFILIGFFLMWRTYRGSPHE